MRRCLATTLRVLALISASMLLFLPLAACTKASDEGSKIPGRIVSLSPGNTEILFALGLDNSIVGVADDCDFPPQAAGKAKIGRSTAVDTGRVISLEPDLILAANIHRETIVPELERQGLRVLTISAQTIRDVLDAIALVGVIAGKAEEAGSLVSSMERRVNAVGAKLSSVPADRRPRTFCVTQENPLSSLGSGTLTHDLIERARGSNLLADLKGHQPISLDAVIARNPQVILLAVEHPSAGGGPARWASIEPGLREVEARENNRIHEVDAALVTRPGPRIVDGLELIARLIHPEVFGE